MLGGSPGAIQRFAGAISKIKEKVKKKDAAKQSSSRKRSDQENDLLSKKAVQETIWGHRINTQLKFREKGSLPNDQKGYFMSKKDILFT